MNWEPAHADHSIESVNAIFTLAAPIDPNIFDEILVAGRKAASAHQFSHRVEGIEPLQLNAPAGAEVVFDLTNAQTRRRVAFQRIADGKAIGEFAIGSTSFALSSTHYTSWTDLVGMLGDLLKPVDVVSGVLRQVQAVQLQYVDRFVSTIPRARAFEVVSAASKYLAPVVGNAESAFHSHIGWFDYLTETTRRLTNVNVDLVDDLPPPTGQGQPSRLGILTMARLEARDTPFENPLDELHKTHYYLKELFQDIITEDAAARVHLND